MHIAIDRFAAEEPHGIRRIAGSGGRFLAHRTCPWVAPAATTFI
jgi:hypothetical protein